MDPRLLKFYNRELQHLREMGAEFASEFPKIAGRLTLDGFECVDPYVERLLEGFAFLAARVQLRIDSEFPRFTQHLFEIVYPHYLAPTPSMAVVQFEPDLKVGALADGYTIPRGESIRSLLGKGETTACEYRTAQDCTLWPLEIVEAEYFSRALLFAARTNKDGRAALSGNRLSLYPAGQPRERRYADSVDALKIMLVEHFGITLPVAGDLEPALQRVIDAAPPAEA